MATPKQEIEHLAKLMKKIDIAMLATVGKGGHLVSRPLSTQCATFDGERVWFLTERDTPTSLPESKRAKSKMYPPATVLIAENRAAPSVRCSTVPRGSKQMSTRARSAGSGWWRRARRTTRSSRC